MKKIGRVFIQHYNMAIITINGMSVGKYTKGIVENRMDSLKAELYNSIAKSDMGLETIRGCIDSMLKSFVNDFDIPSSYEINISAPTEAAAGKCKYVDRKGKRCTKGTSICSKSKLYCAGHSKTNREYEQPVDNSKCSYILKNGFRCSNGAKEDGRCHTHKGKVSSAAIPIAIAVKPLTITSVQKSEAGYHYYLDWVVENTKDGWTIVGEIKDGVPVMLSDASLEQIKRCKLPYKYTSDEKEFEEFVYEPSIELEPDLPSCLSSWSNRCRMGR